MKDKLMIVVGAGIATLVLVTLAFYTQGKETIELFDIVSIAIIMIIVLTSTYLIYDRFKNLRAGLPTQDERLRLAGYKAGYHGFIAAIWSAVGSNMGYILLFDEELRGGLVVAAVVLVSGFVFMISYIYHARKGN